MLDFIVKWLHHFRFIGGNVINGRWIEKIREDFPALKQSRNGKPPVYFDNACTTLVPQPVIEAINKYYTLFPACGGNRSRYWFSEEVTDRIEGNPGKNLRGSRHLIKDFINAGSEKEIIFTLNTSHALNMVALGFNFRSGDTVLLTDKEHNSNLIPWLRLQKKGLIKVEHTTTREDDTFDLDQFEQILKRCRIRLVSMAYTSNLTGYTIPAEEIIRIAHRYGALVLLDGAQAVPQKTVDVQQLDVDLLAFSLHKMCGPRAVGILYAKKELIEQLQDGTNCLLEPAILGGGAIGDATYQNFTLIDTPGKFEVGIQNYAGHIATAAAIEYLQCIGMDKISAHGVQLNQFLTRELLKQYGDSGWFRILGPQDASLRGGILTFEVKRPNAVGIAAELNEKNNIMIRDGVFCVHSYLNQKFGIGWTMPKLPSEHRMTYRVSLYFYNTEGECRTFLETLQQIFGERSYI